MFTETEKEWLTEELIEIENTILLKTHMPKKWREAELEIIYSIRDKLNNI